jgi:hypothetical protein
MSAWLLLPNYALERSVNGWWVGAAGALEIIAPAAPDIGVPRPAQRGRWASQERAPRQQAWSHRA